MDLTVGMLLVVLAGALEGLFSLGVTRTPRWKWENVWGMGSLVALLLVPWPVALLTVPHLADAYRQVPAAMLALTFLFGIGWGLGGIFWGKAIAAVGVALGVSLLMGLITVTGSLGPMLVREPNKLTTPGGLWLVAAMALMILGVVFISLAGRQKERDLKRRDLSAGGAAREGGAAGGAADGRAARTPFVTGLLFCVISGVLSAAVNFGLIYGGPVAAAAKQYGGAADSAKANAIWALVFTGNYLVNFLYALVLMVKNRSASQLKEGGPSHWFWALFLGISWPLGIVVYGVAAGKLGAYGAYAGFPMMLLCAILFGNLAGAMTGEWRGTTARPRATMLLGVVTLVVAFVVFGWANKLLAA